MQLQQIIFRSLCDESPGFTTDCAFLFGQTADNQNSVLATAIHLLNTASTRKIVIMDTHAKCGYPGFTAWQNELLKSGISADLIEGVPTNDTQLNTRTEAQALVRHALAKGYRSLHVIASPFQQPRAFMTTVTIAIEEFPELLIYSRPGTVLPWSEHVTHSQGTLAAPRYKLIETELERIATYQQKGDLASFELVTDYLNKRDKHSENTGSNS